MRVFFKLPGSNIQLCDYMFHDEKVTEVIERIKELLDIALEEDDLDLNTERNASKSSYSKIWLKRPLKRRPKIGFQDRWSLLGAFCNTFDLH